MEGYITKFNGTPVYAMSAKKYIEERGSGKINPTYIYAIVDKDNYLIQGNYVMGQAVDKFRKVKLIPNGQSWKGVVGVVENVQRNPYETEQAKAKVQSRVEIITERPTVEKLADEGKAKLDDAIAKAQESIAQVEEVAVVKKPRTPRKRKIVEEGAM